MPFKVGDRVRLTVGNIPTLPQGSTGTVVYGGDGRGGYLGVEWDDYPYGHDCGGRCQYPRGLYIDPGQISLELTPEQLAALAAWDEYDMAE